MLVVSAAFGDLHGEQQTIKTDDGYRLAYEKVGRGPDPVMVPARLFLAEPLRGLWSRQRTIVFYDMRDRGRSESIQDLSKISVENDVRDLEAVRRHFKFERVSIVGYSYLGLVAALYAMEHPEHVERVVQLGPIPLKYGTSYPSDLDNTNDRSVFDETKWERLQRLEKSGDIERHPREFCETDWDFLRVMLVAHPPTHLESVKSPCEMPNEWPIHLRPHSRALFSGSIAKLDVSRNELASRVTMPVLIIHGVKDRNAPYGAGREWARLLPNARLITLENAAHNSWADERDLVIGAGRTFLAGSWPGAARRVTAN